jgi:pilus assembly protein Flp/PilA
MKKVKSFISDEVGATAIEYALIASAMALALVTTMPTLGNVIRNKFTGIGDSITSGS